MLDEFIEINRDELIRRCRTKVARRPLPLPTEAEIDHGVPLFLEQLTGALRGGEASGNPEIAKGAGLHGHDLLLQGFTVSQVVHDYGDICQAVTELALETNAPISTEDFRMLNRCLDDAIAAAVTTFGRESQHASDAQSARGTQRMGFFVHELRNLVNTAIVALEVLRTGNVGVGGSTGAVLNRSLLSLRSLIARSLAEVRLTEGIQQRQPIVLANLVQQIAAGAGLEAGARGITFVVAPVDAGLTIEGDEQVLTAVVGNLIQNAFKFTRPHTTVTLQVACTAERVWLEVHDECGGLPGGSDDTDVRLGPFEQRGTDRTGMGIGLAFCRWGAEANHGRLYARNHGEGCVFTLDLPRSAVPAAVPD